MNALEERAYDKHFVLCCWLVLRNLHSRNLPFISMKCFHFHKLIIAAWPITIPTTFLYFPISFSKFKSLPWRIQELGFFKFICLHIPQKLDNFTLSLYHLKAKLPMHTHGVTGALTPPRIWRRIFYFFFTN